jgi:hypothetical protein
MRAITAASEGALIGTAEVDLYAACTNTLHRGAVRRDRSLGKMRRTLLAR